MARNAYVREKLVEMLGGLPEKDTLNPVVTRTLDREGYRIESVLFDSRPGLQVSGNVYLPTGGDGPFPAVVAPGGRHELGRLDPAHQLACLNLVRGGFAVLAFDTIGQGERRHYWNPSTRESELDDPGLERELCEPLDEIERHCGRRPSVLAYPYGYFDDRVVDRARSHYRFAVTTGLRALPRKRVDPMRAPRLDVYYLRTPRIHRRFGRIDFQIYVHLRRALRKLRGHPGEIA